MIDLHPTTAELVALIQQHGPAPAPAPQAEPAMPPLLIEADLERIYRDGWRITFESNG